MKLPRRRFLTILGATPIAAKVAADEVVAKAAGVKMTGLGTQMAWLPGGELPQANPTPIPYDERQARALAHLDMFGVPGWVEQELRGYASEVSALDPDLAAKRSWSMAVKIAEQRERNYRQRLELMREAVRHSRERSLLRKLLGFDWPW